MPRYTLCPYYIDENNKTISCEDVCRSFDSMDEKWQWMDMYCDSWDWMRCPYAADRSEAYRRAEKGETKALAEQEAKAQKKEIESLLRKLGRANKKIERMQKKIDDLRAVNKSFVQRNEDLSRQNREAYSKWRGVNESLERYEEVIASQVQVIADAYEARLAYMIDRFGTFSDLDVDEWRQGKSFALVYDEDDDGYPCWQLVFKEEGDEDGHEDTDIPEQEQ